MIAKRFGGNANGAKTADGARRNKKTIHKSGADDKKLQAVLKKMQLNSITGIEEVNIFKNNGEVIHITNPKIQASIPSNTFVVTGNAEVKQMTELLPNILSQLGPESLERLRKYAESLGANGTNQSNNDDDDDEVPDLVENFEEAANK
eukprot:CAMPEP_0196764786 /NCGR_PEP_ID=MMETSP1095-20130614/6855_1 /TAXON_ID=96789 ORGANISM="Chromulina nebulosa, Strain UTEXLB2642" /NCGR_SAMPLE_ID=MMETSP1095 /ASSEMBLY_ACC=CAM_ASM_000446 /LENGTH=147 /DNA_ID=CAMNT_0042121229 /DNA_START=87 /DNA_END=530 /DNA_ORIENTATION=-